MGYKMKMQRLLWNKYTNRIFRNRICLDKMLVRKRRINLEWWKQKTNLGDTLAPIIYQWMLEQKNLTCDMKVSKTIHLITVGSLIGQGEYDAVVWGSGILDVINTRRLVKQSKYRKLDVRAVRGPISQFVLEICGYECPAVYGDPAILMPYIYKPKKVEKKYDISIILHHSQDINIPKEYHAINIQTNDYKKFIDEICESKKIISSSLHGIILSEVYKVPAVFLKTGIENEIVKFYDWYFSTKRTNIKFANTIEEAEEMVPMELPELEEMRKNLYNQFPYDLWENV